MLGVNKKIGYGERLRWIRIHIDENYIGRRRTFDFFLKKKNCLFLEYSNYDTRGERIVKNAKKKHLLPSSEEFESRFPDGLGKVLLSLTHKLNVKICPLKKEILNELIVNYEI
jgi:hypothetical protein